MEEDLYGDGEDCAECARDRAFCACTECGCGCGEETADQN